MPEVIKLPMLLPDPCPICDAKVYLTEILVWDINGEIMEFGCDCETEPSDIESDEWADWFAEHYKMPYVDWLPYEVNAKTWLRQRYAYNGENLCPK
jgi:hypothetical protein